MQTIEITKETYGKISDYLLVNNQYDAIEAIASMNEKQASGIVKYINAKRALLGITSQTADQIVLNTVLYDLQGFSSGNDMFVAKTASFQPQDL